MSARVSRSRPPGLGTIQLGSWWVQDRFTAQLAFGSIVAITAFAIASAPHGTAPATRSTSCLVIAVGNGIVAALYAVLPYRERTTATA